jgi:ectoine hydroxylase-related dioxygenase (phytanoyl-CoA dioxygenase family)
MPAVDREFFQEHGWVIVRKAVAPERIARIERAFDRRFPSPADQTDAIYQIYNLARYQDPFADWIRDEVGGYVAAALGCAAVRLLEDSLLLKRAGGGGRIEWHQDYSYMSFLTGARAAAVRLALNACSVASGCMHVADRSHTWGLIGPSRAHAGSKVVSALPADRPAEVIALELEPGDLTIHHTLTFHGSFENTSDIGRKTIVVHAFDASSVLDRAHVPPDKLASYPTDAAGRVVGPTFPLIHRPAPV